MKKRKKKILVAILNWGLGHAARSIPLIKALKQENFEPVLASDGDALQLLKKEFPHLKAYVLPSYRITYPKNGKSFSWHFVKKSPQLLKTILSENRRIKKIISEEKIDGIISDNRAGAYSKQIPSVYITHQINVLTGMATFFSSKIHQFFMNQFSELWVPDLEEKKNLSGKMGHGSQLKIPIRYLGVYSRFQKKKATTKYDLLVLLSGPEPQRSILENMLAQELDQFSGKILFVRGKIGKTSFLERNKNMESYDFLTGKALENALNQSSLILSRSGYSTILDLAVLEKKAFFIPTPGQFEQEYLAKRMKKLKIAPFCGQKEFNIEKLVEVSNYSGFSGFEQGLQIGNLFGLFESK